jgi:hypothetical protein
MSKERTPFFAFSEILLGLSEILAPVSVLVSAVLDTAQQMGGNIFSVILWVREPITKVFACTLINRLTPICAFLPLRHNRWDIASWVPTVWFEPQAGRYSVSRHNL